MKFLKHIIRFSAPDLSCKANHTLRTLILAACLALCPIFSIAQVGIQTDTPDPSSALEIASVNKGLLIPRLSLSIDLSSPSPVTAPATGLIIYNNGANQEHGFYYWSGISWVMLKPQQPSDMHGPAFSTDNAIARFDGTEGNTLQNSVIILDDAGNITGVNKLTTAGFTMATNAEEGRVLSTDATGVGSWVDAILPTIEEDDIEIAKNVGTLNFQGAVEVQDDGGNQVSVIVTESISEERVIQVSSTISIDLNVFIIPVVISWNVEFIKDAVTFSHQNATNPERITVLQDGMYEVNYMFSFDNTNNKRKTLRSRIRVNGVTYIEASAAYGFIYSSTDDKASLVSSSFLVELNAGDYIEVAVNGQTNDGAVNLIAEENLLFVRVLRTW